MIGRRLLKYRKGIHVAGVFLPFLLTGFTARFEPVPPASVSWYAPADTVTAGEVFIHQLPDSLDGMPISGYTASRIPLKSWLLERSLFWSTGSEDRGEHAFELSALATPGTDSTRTIPYFLQVVVR